MEPLSRPIEQCVEMIFPTPLAVHHWPDDGLNGELGTLILAEEAAGDGVAKSNVGGWHSPMEFLFGDAPCLAQLRGRIQRMTGELTGALMRARKSHRFTFEGWANVLRDGDYHSVHVHPNATWSGVYYVTGNPAPEDAQSARAEFSGKIEFLDPRPGASATYSVENVMQRRCLINPPAGAMVMFPSWMPHLVHPYHGPGARISIAFNVIVQ